MASSDLDLARILHCSWVATVEWYDTIESTNDRAKQLAIRRAGPLPALIVAGRQTAGRGRGTRRWWTGRGALAMSLLVDFSRWGLSRRRSPLVALASAVAMVEAVRPHLSGQMVGLHWPNDVYVDQRKLAGVLVEVPTADRLVIGIGINTNNTLAEAPRALRQTAVTLLDLTGRRHDHTSLVLELLAHLDSLLAATGRAPDEIGQRADALCLQRGRTLTIDCGGRSVRGRCMGIARDGALMLQTPEGPQRFLTGTVIT